MNVHPLTCCRHCRIFNSTCFDVVSLKKQPDHTCGLPLKRLSASYFTPVVSHASPMLTKPLISCNHGSLFLRQDIRSEPPNDFNPSTSRNRILQGSDSGRTRIEDTQDSLGTLTKTESYKTQYGGFEERWLDRVPWSARRSAQTGARPDQRIRPNTEQSREGLGAVFEVLSI